MKQDDTTSDGGVGALETGGAPARCADGGGDVGDAELVARAAAGDRGAFAELYRRHVSMVHGVVLAALRRGARSEAEDVTQEVFVTAWGRLSEVRDGAAAGAWLVSIARSRAVDWVRAGGRRRRREARRAAADRPGTSGSVREAEGARGDEVLAMVCALPEAYREVMVLRFVVGMTGPQIGLCLQMTPGSVRVNLHRGMARLRAAMSEVEQ